MCLLSDCFAGDENYVTIGDVSLPLRKPLKPEFVPVKYSKHAFID